MTLDARTIAKLYCPEGETVPEWVVAAIQVAMTAKLHPKNINEDYIKASNILGIYDHPYAGTRKEEFMMLKHSVRKFLSKALKYTASQIARYEGCTHSAILNSIHLPDHRGEITHNINILTQRWHKNPPTNTKLPPESKE